MGLGITPSWRPRHADECQRERTVPPRSAPRPRRPTMIYRPKRHIDKPDRRPRGVDLPAIVTHIDQPAICQTAVLQMCDFVGGRLAERRHAQCRLNRLRHPRRFPRHGLARPPATACPRRRACRRARCVSPRQMPAASDREQRSRRRCGGTMCLRPAIARPSPVSHLADSQSRLGSADGRDWRCRAARRRQARGWAVTRRRCRSPPGDPP